MEYEQNKAPIIASPDDIDREFSHRAYHGTSFSPEKRGDQDRQDYAAEVNRLYAELWPVAKTDEQKTLLAGEMERYRQGYIKHLNAYLSSHANVVSSMIAGPARFPVARMQKRGRWADNKVAELLGWEKRARAAIKEKLLDARPEEEKDAAGWAATRKDMAGSLAMVIQIDKGISPFTRSAFVSSIAGKIERLAQAGDVAMVAKALSWLAEHNTDGGKPAFTPRHKVWTYGTLAKEAAARNEARAGKPQELLGEAGDVELWADYHLDRAQLMFPDKPDQAMREKLKGSGWKWSPSQGAWQRQLTDAAISSGKAILAGLTLAAQGQNAGPVV